MKTYQANRALWGTTVKVVNRVPCFTSVLEHVADLPLRLDLAGHSPTGFAWGCGGSGPAQLALALLADAVGEAAVAWAYHQDFKWRVVSTLPHDAWTLSHEEVLHALGAIQRAEAGEAPLPF